MYAPLTEDEASRTFEYGDGKVAAKAIRVDMNLNISDSPLYADGEIAERLREFIDGTMAFTPDDLPPETRGDWLGNQTEEETIGDETVEVLDSSADDLPGYFGFGYIIPKVKNKIRQYRAIFFPKVQFGEPNETAETKGASLTWQTPAIEGKIMRRIDGKWKREITVTSLDTALNWLRDKLNVPKPEDAHLTSLTLGTLVLSPAFDGAVKSYSTTTSTATAVITAVAVKTGSTIAIKVGETTVTNGESATFTEGDNTVEITVTYKSVSAKYTVTVTYSTE
jgi:hypothetical protein